MAENVPRPKPREPGIVNRAPQAPVASCRRYQLEGFVRPLLHPEDLRISHLLQAISQVAQKHSQPVRLFTPDTIGVLMVAASHLRGHEPHAVMERVLGGVPSASRVRDACLRQVYDKQTISFAATTEPPLADEQRAIYTFGGIAMGEEQRTPSVRTIRLGTYMTRAPRSVYEPIRDLVRGHFAHLTHIELDQLTYHGPAAHE